MKKPKLENLSMQDLLKEISSYIMAFEEVSDCENFKKLCNELGRRIQLLDNDLVKLKILEEKK